jgi:hypothetical protein
MSEYIYYTTEDRLRSELWPIGSILHRLDGPAIEYYHMDAIAMRGWCIDGKWHRENGPSFEHGRTNEKYWFLYGKQVTEEEFNEITDSVQRKLIWG